MVSIISATLSFYEFRDDVSFNSIRIFSNNAVKIIILGWKLHIAQSINSVKHIVKYSIIVYCIFHVLNHV